ncbi:MAG: DNA gyrase subunit A, partial [Flavisolibacter sp.]|nr:DNA gyrase subunit A [Flavisolibacter sp.]
KGVKTISVTEKTGKLVGILDVSEKEDLMITCQSGVTIRMKVSDIRELGRATQGVKLIRIDEGDKIAAITRIDVQDDADVITDAVESTEATNQEITSSDEENPVQL